jgi:two-component system sensor histidine kinase RegB
LRRCREIIDGMAGDSGHAAGEMPTVFGQCDLRNDLLARLSADERSRTRITHKEGPPGLFLPRRAVTRIVSNLIRNALDATQNGAVLVDIDASTRLRIRVSDTGPGMPPAVLSQAGEPFFTTKAPGHGLGLGLFLARSLADYLGGSLVLDSTPGRGTTALLDLPLRIDVGAARA